MLIVIAVVLKVVTSRAFRRGARVALDAVIAARDGRFSHAEQQRLLDDFVKFLKELER